MKFVFFGYDFSLNIVERLLEEGHTLCGIFTFPCDGIFNFNTQLDTFAAGANIPISEHRPTQLDIDNYIQEGVQVFIAAGYPYKIPNIDENKAYGINVHPSFLPKARGLMPTPHILMHEPEAGGVTLHKISQQFDTGDILLQTLIPIHEHETVETYSARIAMATPGMAADILNNIENFWKNAQPQNEKDATNAPPPTDGIRTLNWETSVHEIAKISRAFGRFGCLCTLNNQTWAIYQLDAWEEAHTYKPGTIVHQTPREVIIVAKDGFVCMKDGEKL